MEQARETWIRRTLLALAFTALASLLLIAVFIIQEGAPFLARIGIRDFLFASDWNPQAGRFGIRPMIAASLWVTVGAMLVGGPMGIAGAIFLNEFVPVGVMRTVKPMIELLALSGLGAVGFIALAGVLRLAALQDVVMLLRRRAQP